MVNIWLGSWLHMVIKLQVQFCTCVHVLVIKVNLWIANFAILWLLSTTCFPNVQTCTSLFQQQAFWEVNRCGSSHTFLSLPFILSSQVASFLVFFFYLRPVTYLLEHWCTCTMLLLKGTSAEKEFQLQGICTCNDALNCFGDFSPTSLSLVWMLGILILIF